MDFRFNNWRDRVAGLVGEQDKIRKIIPNLTKTDGFHIGDGFSQITNSIRWSIFATDVIWHNDAFYASASGSDQSQAPYDGRIGPVAYTREDGSRFLRWFYAKREYDDEDWQYLGFYDIEEADKTLLNFIPCDDGRFIFISLNTDLHDNKRPDRSPFSRMSIPNSDKKEFRVDSSIDHGQEKLREYMSDKKVFNLAWMSSIVMTDKFATLVNCQTGLYWIFSKEKASLVKAGNIFNKMTTEQIVNGGFERGVLCVNPEKDGTVLVSAQDEDFLTGTVDLTKKIMELQRDGILKFKSSAEANEWMAQQRQAEDKNSPFIVWYRIYPETGKVEKLALPPEGGTLHREGSKNDVWRPMPNGSVKMGWESITAIRKEAEQKTIGKADEKSDEKADPATENKEEKAQADAPPAKADGTTPQTGNDARKNDTLIK
jgi:hypothetical protein